ncbi:hypothetical protein G6F61_015264 [Rhizopus arrhizus]|nr:hypothetical protein G6F61_015264 [Rhizopus arrhizus]
MLHAPPQQRQQRQGRQRARHLQARRIAQHARAERQRQHAGQGNPDAGPRSHACPACGTARRGSGPAGALPG